MKRFLPPLRFSIPVILLALGGLLLLASLQYELHRAIRRVEYTMMTRAQLLGNMVAGEVEAAFRTGDIRRAREMILHTKADRDLVQTILLDATNTVIFSSRIGDTGQSLRHTRFAAAADLVEEARNSLAGQARVLADQDQLLSFFPVRMIETPLRQAERIGVLAIAHDLSFLKAMEYRDALQRTMLAGLSILVFSVLLWLFFHWALLSRADRLIHATQRIASGDYAVRSGLEGADELASMSAAFDQMAWQLQQQITELRDSEKRFRNIIERGSDLIFLIDRQNIIRFASPSVQRILARGPESMVDAPLERFVHQDDLDTLGARLQEARARPGEPIVFEVQMSHMDRSWRCLEAVATEPGSGSAVPGIILNAHDITERKRAVEQMQQAKESAEAASRAKDQFLAILSHELRTPLTPVTLLISSLVSDPSLSEEAKADMAVIREQVELETRLIDDLLDLTRIIHGKLRLTLQPVELHPLLQQTLAVRASELKEARLGLTVELLATNPVIQGDPPRLQQVFSNVIRNAIKFTPSGGSITVRTRDGTDEQVEIEISDTGMGIEPALLPIIFDPFQQGDTSLRRRAGGMGLGLSIAKGIVELHGGTISAFSAGTGLVDYHSSPEA